MSRVLKPRHYFVQVRRRFRRNESLCSDVSSADEFSSGLVNGDVALRGRRNAQKMMSSAALGKYDVKIKRRVMPKSNAEVDVFLGKSSWTDMSFIFLIFIRN